MIDDQIAREFVQKFLIYRNRGVAVSTFVALVAEARREARTEERARCLGIVERYADLAEADWSVVEIYDDIKQG